MSNLGTGNGENWFENLLPILFHTFQDRRSAMHLLSPKSGTMYQGTTDCLQDQEQEKEPEIMELMFISFES